MDINLNSSMDIAQNQIDQYKTDSFTSQFENADDAELREAAEDFESYFLQLMFKEMQKTVNDEDSLIPKSNAENIFTDMLVEEQSKQIASGPNSIGLANSIYNQIKFDLDNKI